jgi:pimeloyl-ACP methyl ester carboxylesterase
MPEAATALDEPSSTEAALGAYLLRGMSRSVRFALGATVEVYRDEHGRETPCLIGGKARLGTLVFLHGFADRADSFLITALLLRRDFRVIVPAVPGFAEGWVDERERYSFAAYARWLGDVVERVAPARFHLMGNSLGGASALGIATRMPDRLASLTLCDTAGVRPSGVTSLYDEVEAGRNLFEVRTRAEYRKFLRRVFAKRPLLPRPVVEHLYMEQRRNADWYARITADLHHEAPFRHERAIVDLTKIRIPTLVVWGERDSLFPVAIGEHTANSIPGAKLQVLRGVGHVPHLEAPSALARAFTQFVSMQR